MAGVFAISVVGVLAIILAAWASSVQRGCPIDPVVVHLGTRPKAEGLWARTFDLALLEKIMVGPGPEDLAFDSLGRIYTAVADGWVKRIGVGGEVENHTFVGGRPLGIALGPGEEIYVATPGQGLLKISSDGAVHVLSSEAEGQPFYLADGVVVAKDGTVYFTDATTKFEWQDHMLDLVEAGRNGRVLKYDPSSGSTTVLVKEMAFPNGVALSEDEDFLLICETSRARVMRYWLKGEKKGTLDIFLDGLLAYPDNVRLSDGNFYVGLPGDRTEVSDWFFTVPYLRCFVAKPSLLTTIFGVHRRARLIVVNPQGKILRKFEDPVGKVMNFVTGGSKMGDFVYLSGLGNDFLGKIPL